MYDTGVQLAGYVSPVYSVHSILQQAEFDTLGTWDTRLNVALDEAAMLRTGEVVPDIGLAMVGVASHVGRRTYQEDRYCKEIH